MCGVQDVVHFLRNLVRSLAVVYARGVGCSEAGGLDGFSSDVHRDLDSGRMGDNYWAAPALSNSATSSGVTTRVVGNKRQTRGPQRF